MGKRIKRYKTTEERAKDRLMDELMRAAYFKKGGKITRYPIGMSGMWMHAWHTLGRFRQRKPSEHEIERMLRLREHAIQNGATKVQLAVEDRLVKRDVVINDKDDGKTTWTFKEEDDN